MNYDPSSNVVATEISNYCKLHSLPESPSILMSPWGTIYSAVDAILFTDTPLSVLLDSGWSFHAGPGLHYKDGVILTYSSIKSRYQRRGYKLSQAYVDGWQRIS